MNKKQWAKFLKAFTDKMNETSAKKNADYTGTGDDPFANFSRVEVMGVCTTLQGMLTRMLDKYSRLVSFSQRGFLLVADESFEDTCMDLSVYSALVAAVVKSAKDEARKNGRNKIASNKRRKKAGR